MAVPPISGTDETPLLDQGIVCNEKQLIDYKGRPVNKSQSGAWKSAYFIIGVEVAERLAYYGIGSNLVSYLTGPPLWQSTATAAENINVWSGMAFLLPLFGGFVADAFLGPYRTIIMASLLYILALGLLTLSAVLPFPCLSDSGIATGDAATCSQSKLQSIIFFCSLYLAAFAQGGHNPCIQAFGADQFDPNDPEECKAKSSFFNWYFLGANAGPIGALVVLNYIQDNFGWGLGFGIPCIAMVIALVTFLLGNPTYRFTGRRNETSAFIRIGKVFVKAAMNWRVPPPVMSPEEEALGTLPHQGSQSFKFLNKALLLQKGSKQDGKVCSISDVEEAKMILRLVPVWATCLAYAIVFAQFSTLFTKQGVTMDRSLGPIQIPPASLQFFICISIIILVPTYDRIVVPIAKSITGQPSGITMLQRIGIGFCLSVLSMMVAALVELKRLKTALDYGLIDSPSETVPMSVWWLIPQYILTGSANVFTMIGLQEFFYDQVPSELRSVGIALNLSIFGIGRFLSSFLISIIQKTTGGDDRDSWFSDNLNRAHLDYFYWLLACLTAVAFVIYLYFAKSYIYKRQSTCLSLGLPMGRTCQVMKFSYILFAF